MKSFVFLSVLLSTTAIAENHSRVVLCNDCKTAYSQDDLDKDIAHLSSELVRTLQNIRNYEARSSTTNVSLGLGVMFEISLNEARQSWNDHREKLKSLVSLRVANDLAEKASSHGISTKEVLSGRVGAQMFVDFIDSIGVEESAKKDVLLTQNLYYETLAEKLKEHNNFNAVALFGAEGADRAIEQQKKLNLIPTIIGTGG